MKPIAIICGWIWPTASWRKKRWTVYKWIEDDEDRMPSGDELIRLLATSSAAGYVSMFRRYEVAALRSARANGTVMDELRDAASATGAMADLDVDVSEMRTEEELRQVEEIGQRHIRVGTRMLREAAMQRGRIYQTGGDGAATDIPRT